MDSRTDHEFQFQFQIQNQILDVLEELHVQYDQVQQFLFDFSLQPTQHV